jgi:hypothetical protein
MRRMRYDDFLARYRAAHESWTLGRIDSAGAADQIERLRALVPQIEEPDRHAFAEFQLAQWTAELSPQAQDRMVRAAAVFARAGADGGSDAERVERARRGRTEISAIAAETDDEGERTAILAMNESLTLLIESFET